MPDEISFEEGLKKLEETVTTLENGDLPLKESVEKFEKGMGIANICTKRLEEAEQKIKKIVKENGKISLKPAEEVTGSI